MDVCKKTELNPLGFDRDIWALSQKKYFQKFTFFHPASEKRRKSVGFQDLFYMVSNYPPFSICGITLMIGGIKELGDVYDKQVRSMLELAVPVWQPALTQNESKQNK